MSFPSEPHRRPKAVLFDMDGVLYNTDQPIPGAAETLRWIEAQKIPHLFVTNTTSRARSVLVEKLGRFGIPAAEDEILTPCVAAVEWLRAQPAGPLALFVRQAARPEFDGLPCLPDGVESGAHYVIIGDLGEGWDYLTLNRAFRLLHSDPASVLVALGMTRFWQAADGLRMDVAPFVAALEHAVGRRALVFGKPAEPFFRAAVDKLRLPPPEVLMVGDDIETDIAGARQAGLQTALVKTGKFRPADLAGPVTADITLDSVASLPAWWQEG